MACRPIRLLGVWWLGLSVTTQTRALHAYLRRRKANGRHPGVLAARRRERARIRSEKGIRCGGRPLATGA